MPAAELRTPAAASPVAAQPALALAIPRAAWLAFLVGLTNPFTLRLVGLMPVSEVILLAAGGATLVQMALTHQFHGPLTYGWPFRILMFCQAVALFGYAISDVWRGSTPSDISRGWARMIFLAFDVVCLAVLFESVTTFVFYQLGVVFSGLHVFINGALFDDPWKFGYGVPLTVLAMLALPLGGPWFASAGMLALAALHWALDFRSMALICILIAGVQLFALPPRGVRQFLCVAGVAALALLVIFKGQLTGEGTERSKRSDAERTAMLSAASEGFLSSSFIGQGSWFSKSNVMNRFVEIRAENAKEAGVGGFGDDDGETMAIHSQVLVGLAEGGILGGCFFIAYGVFLVLALRDMGIDRPWDRLTMIFLFILLSGLLNLFFSPFSGAARVDIAATVGVLLYLGQERKLRLGTPAPAPDALAAAA